MTNKQLFIIVLATFITIVAWVTFTILHDKKEIKTPDQVEQLLEPINPTFDKSVLDEL